MSDRRLSDFAGPRERRSFPRPPLSLNLLLLVIAAGTFAYARHQRTRLDEKTAMLFRPTAASSPAELNRIRDELSQMDLTQAQLEHEVDARLRYLQIVDSEQFYISIDTRRHKLQLRFGRDVVRDCDVQIGEAKTITAPNGKSWTFVPLKGAFGVTGKEMNYAWQVPDWAYALNGENPPAQPRVVPNGLGTYVVFLPNGYVIHSPPPPDSPLQGPKPGSYMVPEADLAAMWPRITRATRVYIF